MKVLICGECYSTNLGDGLIAESLRHLLNELPFVERIDFLDISGRQGFTDDDTEFDRTGFLAPVRRLHRDFYAKYYYYGVVVSWFVYRVLMRYGKRRAALLERLSRYDFLLIGGGQLLRDNRLGFPARLATIVEIAGASHRPVAFFAVGVGEQWSAAGRRLFRKALTGPNVTSIACRDAKSVDRLESEIPSLRGKVRETADPALAMSPDDYGQMDIDGSVGLCVINTTVIRWTDEDHPFCDERTATEFWVSLARSLSERGLKVRLFTNGSPIDHAFAQKIEQEILGKDRSGEDSILLPRPTRPDELVKLIGSFESIVAFRLHALIVAFTLGMPSVALSWDDKIRQFMEKSGQLDRFVEVDSSIADAVAKVVTLTGQSARETPQNSFGTKIRSDLRDVFRRETSAVDD